MSKNLTKYPNSVCINIQKVYDWVQRSSIIQKQIPVYTKNNVKVINEKICGNFNFEQYLKKPVLLWANNSDTAISGTIVITNDSELNISIEAIINNDIYFSIPKGETKSMTVEHFESLSITTIAQKGKGEYYLSLQKKIMDNETVNNLVEKEKIDCIFTDSLGNELAPHTKGGIVCKEVKKRNTRKSCNFLLPSGKEVVLQYVTIKKEGFICIRIPYFDCHIGPIPIELEETLLLCAPPETVVECVIDDASYDVIFQPGPDKDCYIIDLSILLVQHIEVLGNVNVMVKEPPNGKPIKSLHG